MSDRLKRGTFLKRTDGTWQVKLLKAGTLHIENGETGETDRLAYDAYKTACFDGTIEHVSHDGKGVPDEKKPLLTVALRDMPPKMAATAGQKDFYISAFRNPRAFWERHHAGQAFPDWLIRPRKSAGFLRQFLPCVHAAFMRDELPSLEGRFNAALERDQQRIGKLLPEAARCMPVTIKAAPGISTYIGWLSAWEAMATKDSRLLASRFSDRGPSRRSMDPRLATWLDEVIDSHWLSERKPKKVSVFHKVRQLVCG